MSEHTYGPWVAVASSDGQTFDIETADGIRWVTRYGRLRKNDAHLIASAPDLLALLRELIDIEGPCPGTSEWAKKVRTAIAVATGEQQ